MEGAEGESQVRPVGSKYLLEETLGRGATGTVWRAQVREDAAVPGIEPGRPVAIKILREELAADPDVVMRFLRERSVLLRLTHPNIVRVRDLVVEGELLALVMDLVEGPDLFRYLRANGPFSPVAGALLMAQIADALAASHADGIVHRDLKPANVLLATVTVDGAERMHPMLTDFGIARLADSPGITRSHEFVGTPAYVAPESAEGRPQTAAVDVYGAGIMLYELVTGRPPFEGDSPVAILAAHMREEPQRPRTMPEPLWTVIERCLRKNPAERPSAVSLANALRVVAAGIGVHSSPAAVDAAIEVGALLLPDAALAASFAAPDAAAVAGPGLGDAAPTQVLPTGAGGYDPAAATQVFGGAPQQFGAQDRTQVMGTQPGAEDRTQLMGTQPGGPADRTAVMPPVPGAGPAAPPQAETPHPWQTQLRAARDRNQQTEIGYFDPEELAAPQVAPPPYQAPRPGQPPYGPPQGRQRPGYAERPPVAPPPYRASQGGPGGPPYGGPQPYPQGYQQPRPPQGYQQPYPAPAPQPAPAPAPSPARRAEPAPPRRAEPPAPRPRDPRPRDPEPRREPPAREPRRRSPNRMYIPGLGCLKGCLMVLLILAVAGVALWNFTPLPHYWDTVHGWYTSVSDWIGKYTK